MLNDTINTIIIWEALLGINPLTYFLSRCLAHQLSCTGKRTPILYRCLDHDIGSYALGIYHTISVIVVHNSIKYDIKDLL